MKFRSATRLPFFDPTMSSSFCSSSPDIGGRITTASARAACGAVRVKQPLHQQPYGEIEFEVEDPNGYVLVFAERL